MHSIDDEKHLVFECPQLQFIRDGWQELFSGRAQSSMKAFFNQKNQGGVMHFVLSCLEHYEKLCSGDPAENVVVECGDELPDAFDSESD